MRHSLCLVAAAAGVVASASGASAALETYTIDFFSEEEGPVAQQLRLFLPDLTGRQIVETRLVVEFTPSPGFDAGSFYMLVAPPVASDPGEDGFIFIDTGVDLGWTGQGTFRYEHTFTALNGILNPGLWGYDVFPTIDPPILVGRFSADSRWEIDTVEVPSPGALALLTSAGLLAIRRRAR
jgi:hypothetical protein